MSGKGQRLYTKAKRLIPGGTQLLSKRPEMFLPNQWPAYYTKAKGCEVWDLDGKKYIDMGIMGVGSCILGYADPEVNRAVKKAVDSGSMSTLNAPEEVELAELLCTTHPWASMVRYARTGGEAMAIAERIARASTGRDTIAFCGYHGWHDWYLATNLARKDGLKEHLLAGLEPAGVPRGLRGTVRPFHYNKIEELEAIVKKEGKNLAAIIMEPIHGVEPEDHFLQKVRKIADTTGAVLIFDEITVGWKLTHGGAHLLYGVNPDIAVFSKAISNGYPMAAIIGRRKVMQAAQRTFISSTYWTERVGPVAALATIKKMKRVGAPKRIERAGRLVREGWTSLAKKYNLAIVIGGVMPISSFTFQHGKVSQALKTLFVQEMLDRGYLATNMFFASCAHTDTHIKNYVRSVDQSFAVLAHALETRTVYKKLRGPVAHTGFERLN
ncbi:aminotransferase class III [Candidatus Kaiserbacteria bacterium CG10_big_fil_rev_8_21_14_0_10_56_12]|uniref:Aminotransferase class III n=1 Tax=Candidatus Kaiserbacteria bacterium CG10_big_fil_rev_8_21_14_0_10_56_12 TaxID=1974611 RepID=A0A2H0UAH7_9BACT|nr:MAG: aminotransferase class III [Candidatus Kaiserbacteria bacterium CG10_big_fil_rev_8_21_14_0_10_56_12]